MPQSLGCSVADVILKRKLRMEDRIKLSSRVTCSCGHAKAYIRVKDSTGKVWTAHKLPHNFALYEVVHEID